MNEYYNIFDKSPTIPFTIAVNVGRDQVPKKYFTVLRLVAYLTKTCEKKDHVVELSQCSVGLLEEQEETVVVL